MSHHSATLGSFLRRTFRPPRPRQPGVNGLSWSIYEGWIAASASERILDEPFLDLAPEIVVHASPNDSVLLERAKHRLERSLGERAKRENARRGLRLSGPLAISVQVAASLRDGEPVVEDATRPSVFVETDADVFDGFEGMGAAWDRRAAMAADDVPTQRWDPTPILDTSIGALGIFVASGATELPDVTVPLSGGTIGRSARHASIVIADGFLSSEHATIHGSGLAVFLEDRQSTNGTFVNGERLLGRAAIQDGDVLGFGGRAVFHWLDSAANRASQPDEQTR